MARRQRKSEISIPFNFTKPEDILSGRKTATRRATGYGAKPGDTLLAGRTGRFRITAVYRQQLGEMTEEDAKKEGCDSLKDFKALWQRMHPRLGWEDKWHVWVIEWSGL
jgi:hypothetical protein